jgi:hypothetical protein
MGRAKQAMGALAIVAMLAVTLIQLSSPADAQSDDITVIARGLTTPGGFTWNANDVLFVALAGSGGSDPVLPEAPAPFGPLTSGTTGAAAIVEDGCPTALATGVTSVRTPSGRIYGAEAIAELDGQLYLLFSNAGDQYGELDLTNGVYRIGGDGSLELIADHAAFLEDNPPASAPAEGFPNPGNPVAMVAGDGALWIADALNGLITSVTPGGGEELVADLSSQGFAPTDLALGADGSVYASGLGDPAQPESASVVNISPDGEAQTVWTGLTMASGIAIGNDGLLYATELASGTSESAANGIPGSGRLLRQTGTGSADVVAEGLMYPAALGTGPDGAVYFVSGALGSGSGSGSIARYAPDGSDAEEAPLDCEPIAETLSADSPDAGASPVADSGGTADTIEATATPSPSPTPRADETWTPDGAAPTGEVVEVGLNDFYIDMPTSLPAGPVTFFITNYGPSTHSFAIDGPGIEEALTHELEPGQQGAFTVELQAGTYSIICPVPGHRDSGMSLVLTVE